MQRANPGYIYEVILWQGRGLKSLFALEELNCALVLLSGGARVEGAEISALARLGIFLSGIKPVLA